MSDGSGAKYEAAGLLSSRRVRIQPLNGYSSLWKSRDIFVTSPALIAKELE